MEILKVLEASCTDCHRCLRHCPVGAIGFGQDQAWIIEDKCILCGECVNACPQKAKVPYDGTEKLMKYFKDDFTVVASVAPSFVAAFELTEYRQFVGGLKELGFAYVTETVQGAYYVAQEYGKLVAETERPIFSTCCPTVVNLVEKHYPEMISYLAPVVSPMMIHGQVLKQLYGPEAKVVFIGPCIAKMDELADQPIPGVDLVVTFRQLSKLLAERQIDLQKAELRNFDLDQQNWPRSYPIRGGALAAAGLTSEELSTQVLAVTGIEECIQMMQDVKNGKIKPRFLEMMACKGGCINGPEIDLTLGVATRSQLVTNYTKERLKEAKEAGHINSHKQSEIIFEKLNYSRQYVNKQKIYPIPDEDEIKEILRHIGKFTKEDETNCGGCGYQTCRAKAVAVYQGFAEEKMCVPYMKGRIESLAHIIVESSHNGIIVVDQQMIIQEFNPVANAMFNRKNESPIAKPLYRYLDPHLFEEVWKEKKKIIHRKVRYEQYQLVTDQTIFPLEEYGVIVGIITDTTSQDEQKAKVQEMKRMTVEKTAAVVHKQMKIVQEIAKLLGETTVETKAALYELTQLIEDGEME